MMNPVRGQETSNAAVSGLVATIPMTAVMLTCFYLFKKLQLSKIPPKKITEETFEKVGVELGSWTIPATLLSHFGYGALTGSLYRDRFFNTQTSPVIKGSIYGLSVWALSYFALLPSLNYKTNGYRFPVKKNFAMILAHLVWGIFLATAYDKLKCPVVRRSLLS